MFFTEPLRFITEFVENLNNALGEYDSDCKLSSAQRYWIAFCITAILVTNSVCWAKFERAGLGSYTLASLSWMLRRSGIPWEILLCPSVSRISESYGISYGTLVIDDSEKKRSKNTKRISKVHKIKDKKSGGYFMGQSVVFLILVTPVITVPVGFMFYMPDPKLTEWYKLKKQKSGSCPKKPPKNPNYPAKQEIALILPDSSVQTTLISGFGVFLLTVSAAVISFLKKQQTFSEKFGLSANRDAVRISVTETGQCRYGLFFQAIPPYLRKSVSGAAKKSALLLPVPGCMSVLTKPNSS